MAASAAPPAPVRPHPLRAVLRPPARCRAGRRTSATATPARRTCSTSTASRSQPSGGPTLVYLHGGSVSQRPEGQGGPSPHLPPREPGMGVHQRELPPQSGRDVPRSPDRRQEGDRLGARARPGVRRRSGIVFVAGSSAGGHLASLAALTPNDPAFQPGFERADTSVTAAISLYGYYGSARHRAATFLALAYVGRECAAVLRGSRRSGHARARGRRATLRRAAAERLVAAGRLRRAARRRSTRSTCSIPSASRRSSMRSRRSPPGCDPG